MNIQVLLLLSLWSLGLAEKGCIPTSSSLSCVQQSGKFLPLETSSDISSLYIIRSDMSALSKEDFGTFESVDTVSIINSTFLFPKHDHMLSVIPDLSVLCIINCNASEEVSTVFAGNERITRLDLTENKISDLNKEFFAPIKYVQQINLSRNKITSIEVGTFDGLIFLRVLNLTDNNIGISFDPTFLGLQSGMCVVCRNNSGDKECSSDEFARCKSNDPEDQLWWISTIVTIHLEQNPICGIITGKVSSRKALQKSGEIDVHGQHSCKVYEHGHCFKHEGRKMFFLEVCGVTKLPYSIIEEKKPQDSVARADSTMPWYLIPLLIIAVLVGGLITMILVEKGFIAGKKKPKNLTTNSTSSPNATFSGDAVAVNLPEHEDDGQENEESDQLITENRRENHVSTSAYQLVTEIEDNRDFPFHCAILRQNSELIKSFLRRKEHFCVKNRLGDYPIHLAARVNDVKTTKFLLKNDPNVDVNIQNNAGETPLITAARESNLKTLNILLKKKANCSLSNFYGVQPLHLAAWNGNQEMIQILLQHGAKINNADQEGKTPLFYASVEGHEKVVELLLKRGANVNDTSRIRRSPLHIAAWNNYLHIVDILLKHKADVVEKDSGGFSPLHKASRKGHIDVIKKLLSYEEVDVNCVSNGGNTPLHQAAKGGHIEVIQLLKKSGANAEARNNKGLTPLETAQERGQTECLSIFKQL